MAGSCVRSSHRFRGAYSGAAWKPARQPVWIHGATGTGATELYRDSDGALPHKKTRGAEAAPRCEDLSREAFVRLIHVFRLTAAAVKS